MKTSGWVATITAGIVILGGGAWAATTLPASDEGEVAAVEETPTPTPTIEPSVTPTPEATPTSELSGSDAIFVEWANPLLSAIGPPYSEMSDAEMLGYLRQACAIESSGSDEAIFPGSPEPDEHGTIDYDNVTPDQIASRDANKVFLGAARLGYSSNGISTNESYCD